MINIFRINTGSCGGCDAEIESALHLNSDFAAVTDPFEADVMVLTGALTPVSKPAFLSIWQAVAGATPLVAVGRCAIDGFPFGRGGLAENPDIAVAAKVDGCPPVPAEIAAAIRGCLR